MVSPSARRHGVQHLVTTQGCSERRACRLVGIARTSARYVKRGASTNESLRNAIQVEANAHRRYGYRRVTAMLRRQGWRVNHKRVQRLWQHLGLQVPKRPRRKRHGGPTDTVLRRAEHADHVWTYDFMTIHTVRNGSIRILNVLDEFTRECLASVVARSMPARKVLEVLDWLFLTRGAPVHLRSDNGPEFIAQAVQDWLVERHCQTIYITPGSPWENPFIESFNGHFRLECLNGYQFESGSEAQIVIDAWRSEYNQQRPHSSLGYRTPAEFAAEGAAAQQPPPPSLAALSL